jgi:hypothetical protein
MAEQQHRRSILRTDARDRITNAVARDGGKLTSHGGPEIGGLALTAGGAMGFEQLEETVSCGGVHAAQANITVWAGLEHRVS